MKGFMLYSSFLQGHNRNIFLRGQSNFSWFFFPGVKCFFPVENFHFRRPKTNFSGFEKWKAKKKNKKKKKKGVLSSNFSNFHFQFSTFPFTIFLLFFSIFTPFPFFPCLFFPARSAKISRSEVSGTLPPCRPTCYATACLPFLVN